MASRANRTLRRVAAVVAIAVVVGFLATEGYARDKYHQDLWQAGPDRIQICHRDYLGPGHSVKLSRLRADYPQLQVVGEARSLQGARRVWGVHNSANDRTLPRDECTVIVYLQTGADEARMYGLSGGP